MSIPTNRAQFGDYCLRKLGAPVVDVNVSDDQVDDRIDDALKFWTDYNFDGTEKLYYKHLISADDIANRYIILPDNIIGAVRIFELSGLYNHSDGLFDIRYQISMQELYTFTNVSLLPYYMAMTHLQNVEQLLVGKKPIRYNRNTNKLYVEMAWEEYVPGNDYLLVEAYSALDPETYTDVWKDQWLIRYATALIKMQWGSNLKKFKGIKMPGGIEFNGQAIYDEAVMEVEKLEKLMMISLALPPSDMIG